MQRFHIIVYYSAEDRQGPPACKGLRPQLNQKGRSQVIPTTDKIRILPSTNVEPTAAIEWPRPGGQRPQLNIIGNSTLVQNYPAPALEELRLLLSLGDRHRSAFALVLLGDDYQLGSLRLSVQRALFSRISASAILASLPRGNIAAYLDWHISCAGHDRDILAPAAVDLLAEASQGNPRTLGLLAQAAWITAARHNTFTIEAEHIQSAQRQVPAANHKIHQP